MQHSVKFGRSFGSRRLMGLLVILGTSGVVSPLLAQSDGVAAAEALFSQARSLFDDGKISEACEKFAESQRLDPAAGTLLNLARCREAEGKTASAWSAYLAAKRSAKSSGREGLAEEAAKKAKELEARLSHLTVTVIEKVEGLIVTRGHDAIASASYGAKLPVDPDTYTMKASAPGYQEWSAEITIGAGASEEIQIPALLAEEQEVAVLPPPIQDEVEPPPPDESLKEQGPPVAAYVVGGTGLAITAAGFIFGGLAKSKYGDAKEACPERVDCSEGVISDRDTADTFATVSTVGVIAGLAGVATGVVLFILHDPKKESVAKTTKASLKADFSWMPGGGFAQLKGSF